MIGERRHPRDAGRKVYVALRRGLRAGEWVPVEGRGFRVDRAEAVQACVDDAAARMREIARRAGRLRELYERQRPERLADSADAAVLREEVRQLEALARAEKENIEYLFEPPERAHVIVVGHERLRISADGMLAPERDSAPASPPVAPAHAAAPEPSADETFALLLGASLRVVEEMTGKTLSKDGIEDAIVRLRDLHEGDVYADDDAPDEGDVYADDDAPDEGAPDERDAHEAGAADTGHEPHTGDGEAGTGDGVAGHGKDDGGNGDADRGAHERLDGEESG